MDDVFPFFETEEEEVQKEIVPKTKLEEELENSENEKIKQLIDKFTKNAGQIKY